MRDFSALSSRLTRYSSERHLSRAILAALHPPRNLAKVFSRWQRLRSSMACSHYGGEGWRIMDLSLVTLKVTKVVSGKRWGCVDDRDEP